MPRLPAPEQWVIKTMTVEQLAEHIEKYVDFVDPKTGRSVRLPTVFVRAYLNRNDGVLPIIVAVSTLPLVFADGGVWAEDKFDRLRGIDFRIQPEVAACVPKPGTVTEADVRKAMVFLTDKWLIDVATSYAGKCTIIAAALTLIERCLLDQRPAFFITAGRRGGGKTTTIFMLLKAVTGILPAASAWSSNEEERRKALLAHFIYGVPCILWDNIARGTKISCPHIEKSCTATYYMDRRLGVSEMVATAASTIHLFTGNNIAPRGDLASRSLEIRLSLDRHDPENREFKHPDPIGWTDDNRAEILGAFYTILLGNPKLKEPRDAQMKTRFKMWWRLVGSAIEHAASLTKPEREVRKKPGDEPLDIDFKALFLASDAEDEDSTSLAEVLAIMEAEDWPVEKEESEDEGQSEDGEQSAVEKQSAGKEQSKTFTAKAVAELVNNSDNPNGVTLREFLYPGAPSAYNATPKSVGKRLESHRDDPVAYGARTLILRCQRTRTNQLRYFVETKGKAKSDDGNAEGGAGAR